MFPCSYFGFFVLFLPHISSDLELKKEATQKCPWEQTKRARPQKIALAKQKEKEQPSKAKIFYIVTALPQSCTHRKKLCSTHTLGSKIE